MKDKKPMKLVAFYILPEDFEKVKGLAKHSGIGISEFIRTVLIQTVKDNT